MTQELFAQIQDTFKAGKRVMIATQTRATLYQPKHAGMFRPSSNPDDAGVYVQQGKHWVYCLPHVVRCEA